MTNNQIQYMIEVARTGSVNQAARNLFISQSALSNAIRSVEQEFGRKIFHRSSRGVTLTIVGPVAAPDAHDPQVHRTVADGLQKTADPAGQQCAVCGGLPGHHL